MTFHVECLLRQHDPPTIDDASVRQLDTVTNLASRNQLVQDSRFLCSLAFDQEDQLVQAARLIEFVSIETGSLRTSAFVEDNFDLTELSPR